MYGKQLILDLHDCNVEKFTRMEIEVYLVRLAYVLGVERADLHYWDDEDTPEREKQTHPKLKGISVCQFILTSTVVIHTLPDWEQGAAFIDIFSCDDFDGTKVIELTLQHFRGEIVTELVVERK